MDLQGKVALVTGSGRGIGEAICRKLSEHGAAVAVADIDGESAGRVAGHGNSTGLSLRFLDHERVRVGGTVDRIDVAVV